MKKVLLSFLLYTLTLKLCIATVITVSNQLNSPGQYSNLQQAIDVANSGDTLYVHSGSYGSIIVTKALTFIGPGFNPQGQFTMTSYINSIILDPSLTADGIKFIGLNIGYINIKTVGQIQVDSITFERCRFSINTTNFVLGNNWSFINCLFYWTSSGSLDLGNWNNLLISNNIFNNSGSATFIKNSNKTSVLIANNLFLGECNITGSSQFTALSNAVFNNNIFWGKAPKATSDCSYNNNLVYYVGSQGVLPYGTNTGANNYNDIDPLFVNVPVSNGMCAFSYTHNYNLQATSPGHNNGTDGTDIGIYGGQFPMPAFGAFLITGHPPIPQVYNFLLMNSYLPQNSYLGITVNVRRTDGAPVYTGEYFFDSDPGVGNGIPLPIFLPTNDTTINMQVPVNFLQPGYHSISFRFKDTLYKWGLFAFKFFLVNDSLLLNNSGGAPVYTGEYFFDIDPDVGNGIPLFQFLPTTDTTISLQLLANGLPPGQHRIYFRFLDTLGKWGLFQRMEFLICTIFAIADFEADTVCLQDSTSFTNLSTGGDASTLYLWDMNGDGIDDLTHTGIIGVGAPLHFGYKFLTGGVHVVRLITESGGSCRDTIYKQVLVKAYPPVPTPTGTAFLCMNAPNTVYSVPQLPDATSYYWVINPPTAGTIVVLPGDTAIEIDWNDTITGNVQIIAGANYGMCNSISSAPPSAPLYVQIYTPSVGGSISVTPTNICTGSTVYMTLSGHTGTILGWQKRCNGGMWTNISFNGANYSEVPSNSGVCEYRAIVINGTCDATFSDIATLTINEPPPAAGPITGPSQVCEGQQVIYTVPDIPGATTYTWGLPNGATVLSGYGTDSILVNYNTVAVSGIISVFGSNMCGNGTGASLAVNVNPPPTVFIIPNDTIINCNTVVNLTAYVTGGSTPYSFNWTPSALVLSPNSMSTNSVNLMDNTIFTCTITDSLGCTSSAQTTVIVPCNPLIAIAASNPPTICTGDSSVLNVNYSGGGQPYSFTWSSSPGTFSDTLQNPVVYPTITTTYTVTVTGGQTTTSSTTVTVNPLPEPAGAISGPSVIYYGQTGINYSVQPINYATGYIWTLPQGLNIVSGQNTNSVFVNASLTALTGNISVYGTNNCGNGDSSVFPVTLITNINTTDDFLLSVYPNVTSGRVVVSMNSFPKERFTIKLYNQFGATVFEEKLRNEQLHIFDFSNFSNGLYYLQISGKDIIRTEKLSIVK